VLVTQSWSLQIRNKLQAWHSLRSEES